MYDVAIIGAGPAGSVAAITLAHRGLKVILIEQHRFPRDKVCGECLSSLGIEVLGRLGVADVFTKLSPAILSESIIHSAEGSNAAFALPSAMWGLSRAKLDLQLLELARARGTEILQPAKVLSTGPGKKVSLMVRETDSEHMRSIESKYLILADGKGALLGNRPGDSGDIGIKTHFENVNGPRDAVELFGVAGHYAGLAAIEDGLWNSAFSVPAGRVKEFAGDFDRLLEQMMSENPAFAERMRPARRVSEWLACPLPRYGVNQKWPMNVVPVGNAAAALEPIGGEGMGLAMRSGELAAEAIAVALMSGKLNVRALQKQFSKLWRMRSASCRVVAKAISNPGFAELAVSTARASEQFSKLVMRGMGK